MSEGWIKIHRRIEKDKMYFSEPFTRIQAWIDLLLIACYHDSILYVRGNKVKVLRGQVAYSKESLAQRWKWSRGRVIRYLNDLELNQQIVQQKSKIITLISIVKYDIYQCDGTTDDTSDSTTDGTYSKKDKNINNIPSIIPQKDDGTKSEKTKYADYVRLSDKEYEKLCLQYTEAATLRMIEILNNYKGSNGKKYKSDYLAILNWVVKRYMEEKKDEQNMYSNGHSGKAARDAEFSKHIFDQLSEQKITTDS